MALEDKVGDRETLYRVLKRSRKDCLTKSGRVTAALFKDAMGVSVDRDGGRSEAECRNFIIKATFPKRAKAITEISSGLCFEIGAEVEASPSKSNPFHANILLDNNEQKRNIQALILADKCKIVYFDNEMEWT